MSIKFQSGVTLIEMAIVLIVISIIATGVIGGRELMKTSRVSGVISELAYYKNAQNSFVEKYKYRPGDLTSALVTDYFTGNAADTACTSSLGNGKWDDLAEEDLVWLQLSFTGFIKQNINFDPCPSPGAYRDVGTQRPKSEIIENVGYTFLNTVTLYPYRSDQVGQSNYYFLYVLRVGVKSGATDTSLSSGRISVDMHRAIDAKIDQPDTPFTGKYFVSTECIDTTAVTGDLAYREESEDILCTGNLAEQALGTTSYNTN